MPVTKEDMKSKFWKEGISCHHCFKNTNQKQKLKFSERNKQIKLAKSRGDIHLGKKLG